jgi:hypothetical protein
VLVQVIVASDLSALRRLWRATDDRKHVIARLREVAAGHLLFERDHVPSAPALRVAVSVAGEGIHCKRPSFTLVNRTRATLFEANAFEARNPDGVVAPRLGFGEPNCHYFDSTCVMDEKTLRWRVGTGVTFTVTSHKPLYNAQGVLERPGVDNGQAHPISGSGSI